VRERVGRLYPDGAIGVYADAVGAEALSPRPAVRQAAVGGDVERGEPPGERLGDDQRRVVRRHRHQHGQDRRGASVSKQTVYKQFADKQSLFREIVTGTVAEVGDPVSEQVACLRDSSDLEADLPEVARAARPGDPAPGDATGPPGDR
jgi:hypothetical protein